MFDSCNSMDCGRQAPLSIGFPRQEYWSGLPFPSPGDLPILGTEHLAPVWQWLQFSSVAQLCLILCDPMNFNMPGYPVHHQLLELAQPHVHRVSDAIQSFHPLSSPSPPVFNLPQHQSLFQRVSSLYQVAKVLEFQLQHQSFQWIFSIDFL